MFVKTKREVKNAESILLIFAVGSYVAINHILSDILLDKLIKTSKRSRSFEQKGAHMNL